MHRQKQKYYDTLEVDEFWTFVGSKKRKVWLIYAYHRETGEIVSYAWGKRNIDTARKLRNRLKSLLELAMAQLQEITGIVSSKRSKMMYIFKESGLQKE